MNPNNQNVNQLMEITQLTEDQAKLYLEIYGDNLERATNAAFEDIGNGTVLDPKTRGVKAGAAIPADYGDDLATEFMGMDEALMGDQDLAENLAMQQIQDEEEDPNLPAYLRPDQHDLQYAKDTGSQFLYHLQRFVLKKTCPINFIRKDFKELLSSVQFEHKPILIYFHRPDQPQRNNLLLNLLTDNDFSRMVNNCFHPFGMLSSSKEMPIALKLIEYKFIPCMLILKQIVENGNKRVKTDGMIGIPLKSDSIMVEVDVLHTKVSDYLTARNKQIDDIPANIGNRPAKFVFPLAGETRVKKLQQLERERQMKEMQEQKYYEMISEETAKAEQAELAKIEQEVMVKQIEDKRANYEAMVVAVGQKLSSEPVGDEPKIQIAFRLASGTKLTRFFRMSEPVEMIKSYMYPEVTKLGLAEILSFKYDHPPKLIPEDQMSVTFQEFFGGSSRELVHVEDEPLIRD